MWAEKSRENPIQMTRLIMAMIDIKIVIPEGHKTHEAHNHRSNSKSYPQRTQGMRINNKETMNIAVDATVTFWTVFLILQNTDQNIWMPGCIPLGELHTSWPCLRTGVTSVSYWRRNIRGLNEGLGTNDFLWWCNINVIPKKWKFHLKSGLIA